MISGVEFTHPDLLNELNRKSTVSEKIVSIHQLVRQNFDFIHRIGVAVYDAECDQLRTFAHSTDTGNPLPHYSARLKKATSLYQIHQQGKPRVVNDLAIFNDSNHEHAGYRASYTIPMYQDDLLLGFVFFNSRSSDIFNGENLPYFDMIARLVSLLVNMEINHVQTLRGALKTATSFSSHRDPETGAHLERMARFSRLIANEIAASYQMDDEYVESIFWFAPMHDIGKIATPDQILLKPSKLTKDELEVMKNHTTRGREIINTMFEDFKFNNAKFCEMLGNIAESHHENIDGSGYPNGLRGEDIPIEARIIAVADVFDALTSERPYKPAWSNDDAFKELKALSSWKLDKQCVDVLIKNRKQVEEIQAVFLDEQKKQLESIS